MTKIIDTHTHNINETFIVIFLGIPIGYIVYYHHGQNDNKNEQDISR